MCEFDTTLGPQIQQPTARRLLHRVQAAAIWALYRTINALLRGAAWLLWPGSRPATAERVCVFRIGNIGDIVCALPAVREVRRAYPDAQLTLLSSPGRKGMPGAAELLEGADWLDELRVYYAEDIDTPQKRAELLREMRDRHFDVWIDLPNDLSTIARQFRDMAFARMTGAKWARGWQINTLNWAAQAQSEYLRFANEVERMLAIVGRFGISHAKVEFELPRLPETQLRVDRLLETAKIQDKQLVAIAPGAKRSTNLWPSARFAETGRKLAEQKLAIVLIAGSTDAALCRDLARTIGSSARSFAGELTLPESIELLRRCELAICVDSGVQHLASAVGTPCVSLFSFWQMRGKWHPFGRSSVVLQEWVKCHTCLHNDCQNDWQCMKAIEVKDVVSHAIALLDMGRPHTPSNGVFERVKSTPALSV